MTTTDPFRDIFLAGIGALAIGAEKSQQVIEQLVQKGQITIDQGKDIAEQLSSQTTEKTTELRDQIIAARMKTMTKEERDAFAARVAEIAASVDEDSELEQEEAVEVVEAAK